MCTPDARTDRVYRALVELSEVPGSPFAYWVPEGLMQQAPISWLNMAELEISALERQCMDTVAQRSAGHRSLYTFSILSIVIIWFETSFSKSTKRKDEPKYIFLKSK